MWFLLHRNQGIKSISKIDAVLLRFFSLASSHDTSTSHTCLNLQQLKLGGGGVSASAQTEQSHHDTTDEADASSAVSVGHNVPISHAQEGDGNKPQAVQNVVKLLVVMPLISKWQTRHMLCITVRRSAYTIYYTNSFETFNLRFLWHCCQTLRWVRT